MEFVDSNEITKEEKAYYKEKLIGMLQALQEESGVTVQDMKENSQDFPDPADRANFEFERNTTLRIRDRERKLAKKIRKTLKRLEDEEYNVCDECGYYIRKKKTRCQTCNLFMHPLQRTGRTKRKNSVWLSKSDSLFN